MFTKAVKSKIKARIALNGPSGSGKTYSALAIAQGLGKRIAVIDTENRSASLYADDFSFDALDLTTHDPTEFVKAIEFAGDNGYDVVIIDSLSHAWIGRGGCLEQVDRVSKRNNNNSFIAWRGVTPKHNALLDAIKTAKTHVIVTMRSKMEYVVENVKGKMQPRKIGMAPVQRDGVEYEFDIVGEIDLDHIMRVAKTRCAGLDGEVVEKPGREFGETVARWLDDGAERPPELAFLASMGGGVPTLEDLQKHHAAFFTAKAADPKSARRRAIEELKQAYFGGAANIASRRLSEEIKRLGAAAGTYTITHVAHACAQIDHSIQAERLAKGDV